MTIITVSGTVVQLEPPTYWEPLKLQHLVEWPGVFAYVDVPFTPPYLLEGYTEILTEFEAKGFTFDPSTGTAIQVTGTIDDSEFSGTVTSHWSDNTLEDGTRACIISAEMDDKTHDWFRQTVGRIEELDDMMAHLWNRVE